MLLVAPLELWTADAKAEDAAQAAAEIWLKLVDDEKYAESWEEAAGNTPSRCPARPTGATS